jgi:hypothetical protein
MPIPAWNRSKNEKAWLYGDVIDSFPLVFGEMERYLSLDCLIYLDTSLKKSDKV